MIKMKLKNKWFICTSAIGRALRIALQDAVLYLDFCREALGFRLYRLNTASYLRESGGKNDKNEMMMCPLF